MLRSSKLRRLAMVLLFVMVVGLASGCSWFGGNAKPGPGNGSNVGNGNSTGENITGQGNGKGTLAVQGFYVDAGNGSASFPLIRAHASMINYLSPFWYKINKDGSIVQNQFNKQTYNFAQSNHIKLQPLFTNNNGNNAVLNTAASRQKAVSNIVKIVKQKKYDGASIDFQLLKPSTRQNLVKFMALLRKRMPRGKVLTINVIPNNHQQQNQSAYDYKALSPYVDQIILMAYDKHGDMTQPGAVAPYGWVTSNLDAIVHAVGDPKKVTLGIADYGYDWVKGTTKATTLPLKTIRKMASSQKVQRNGTNGEPHFTYSKNGQTHVVWYEDEKSAAAKIRYAKSLNIHGIAVWRLGYEDAAFWTAIRKNR